MGVQVHSAVTGRESIIQDSSAKSRHRGAETVHDNTPSPLTEVIAGNLNVAGVVIIAENEIIVARAGSGVIAG